MDYCGQEDKSRHISGTCDINFKSRNLMLCFDQIWFNPQSDVVISNKNGLS